MNKRQKSVQKQFLNNEDEVIKRLKSVYAESLTDIEKKTKELQAQITDIQSALNSVTDEAEKQRLKSMEQSKIYQKQYQDALKKQISGILDNMQVEEFKTISDYLTRCYEDGFIGTLFDMQGQGIPLCFPIDQEAMVRAVQLDPKISNSLYSSIGEDVAELKKSIAAEVSRGISTGMSFQQVAKQIRNQMVGAYEGKPGGALYRSMLIARTEGHRIQVQSTMDACFKAKDKGADVVKQWDATLDGATRESHVAVDGEIRELDEKFSNGLMFPGDPSGGPAEVCNCRCALLQRARWAVDESFTKMNNFTKELETFESPEEYDEFKDAFFSKENSQYMSYVQQMEEKYDTSIFATVLDSMSDGEYKHYSRLVSNNPVFRKKNPNEGVFTTHNATKADTIRPKSVMKEMNKSETGRKSLEYLEKENVPVQLLYGVDHPEGVSGEYDPIDDVILIYCDVTKTTKETALTVIHEATHRKLGSKGTFDEEVECFKAEMMHTKGHLTNSDIDDIITFVKDHYPDLI